MIPGRRPNIRRHGGYAGRLDLSYSDYVANLVAERYGHPPVATPKEVPAPRDDEQMELTA